MFLTTLYKLLTILNKNGNPKQIAAACALGAVLGLVPGANLLSFGILFFICLVNVNLSMAFLAAALFKIVGYVLDPLSHKIGLVLLTDVSALKPLWTALYNMPFAPFTRFNNTVVLGNFVLGLALLAPVFFLSERGVILYRERFLAKVERWKIMQFFKASKFYSLYQTYKGFRE